MPVEWIALVGPLLTVAGRVAAYAGNVQRYRKKCALLKSRVHLISSNLRGLEQARWTPDPAATKETLDSLNEVLGRAEDLVLSCQRKKTFDFFNTFKNRDEFTYINKQIDHIMDCFHLANHTLLLIGYNDGIFMVALDTLIEDGACKRLPKEKKEKLLKSINESPHNDNMPMPLEKERRLKLIKEHLNAGPDKGEASTSSGLNQDNPMLGQVADFAKQIMEEAKKVSHDEEKVQRVARLAQKVIYLLPHLQSPLLVQDQEATELVTKLGDDLKGALDTIEEPKPGLHCAPPALKINSFSSQQAKQIAGLANGIEQAYQSLTLKVVNHITRNNA